MRVFVTGATGFVGSHIARKLAEAGHDLRVLYRSEKKLGILEGLAYEGVAGDLDDLESLKRACDGCEIVFHVAAKADYWKDDDKAALWAINVDGTRNVLNAAQTAGVRRVVFTSSAAAVGIRPGGALSDETDRFNLPPERYLYAFSKVKAEEIAAEFVASGLDVVILNPTVVIGPGDLNAISGTFVIETARYQWAVPISSGGLAVIDVRDVAGAHVNAIDRGRSGERYILNTANVPYREWFAMIAAACDARKPIFHTPDFMLEPIALLIENLRRFGIETPMDADQTRLGSAFVYFDGSKAYRELFRPGIDIETSLKDTWQWYADRGYIKHNLLTRLIGLF
ncbi:MAG: NAD-dependent epimerase/dehydratase family protein [Chloroflexi bacterium]|nr:NAD-dependent epimerase/dehydratase family protein [Chloroflexota bacterium]